LVEEPVDLARRILGIAITEGIVCAKAEGVSIADVQKAAVLTADLLMKFSRGEKAPVRQPPALRVCSPKEVQLRFRFKDCAWTRLKGAQHRHAMSLHARNPRKAGRPRKEEPADPLPAPPVARLGPGQDVLTVLRAWMDARRSGRWVESEELMLVLKELARKPPPGKILRLS
jgi:hypothetical protein